MRSSLCSPLFFLLSFAIIVSVQSYCIVVNCRTGFVPVGRGCRRRVGRSVQDEGCIGSDKILIDDNILWHDGPVSIRCPEGKVFNENMTCRDEGWEVNSGPWETHHYNVGGRNVVLEVKRSNVSIRVRAVSVDSEKK